MPAHYTDHVKAVRRIETCAFPITARRVRCATALLVMMVASCGGRLGVTTDAGANDAALADQHSVVNDAALADGAFDGSYYGVPGVKVIGPVNVSAAGIAFDDTNVYWTEPNDGKVRSCPLDGCNGAEPTVIASQVDGPKGIVVAANYVYWLNFGDNNVLKCPVSGCGGTPTLVATIPKGAAYPYDLASDSQNLYWGTGGQIVKCAIAGCGGTPTVIASSLDPHPLTSDGTNVYFMSNGAFQDDGTLMRCAVGGCGAAPTPLLTKECSEDGVAVDETNVYWTNYADGTVLTCPLAGCNAPTVLASAQIAPWSIAIDSTNVYWSTLPENGGGNGGGTLMMCTKTGCADAPTLIAAEPKPYGVGAIATNATSVYWAGGGQLKKLTK